MNTLSALDLIIVLAYIVGTTLLGAWFTGRQKDLKTYFVGDRNVGWGLVLISIVATETSTVTFLSVPGLSFGKPGNFTFLQLAIGYLLGRLVIAWLLLPQYFRGECFSAYELLRERFGPRVQRIASAMFIVTRTIADGLRLYLTALLLHQFTGWDMALAVVVMGVTTIVYTYLGGMQAVIWTDLIQFVIYILGAILAAWFIGRAVPGGWDAILATGDAAGKLKFIDRTWTFSSEYVLSAGVIGGAFFSMASHGADQIMVQRYLCARSLGQARMALILSGIVVFVQFALFLAIGVGLYALHAAGTLSLEPGTRQDEVFGAYIVNHMPAGLIGLVIAAVLAAAMSTLSSSLNSSTTAIVSDFYKPLRPGRPERHYLVLSKWLTAVCGVAQMGVAFVTIAIHSDRSVIGQVLAVAGLTTGIILGVFLIGTFRPSTSANAALTGLVTGLTVVLVVWVVSEFGSQFGESWKQWKIAWPWFAPIGALTTLTAAWVADALGIGHGPPVDRSPEPGVR
jgi:SSS family transporter